MIAQSLLAEKSLLCRNGYSTASHTIATICNTRSDKKVAVGGVESPLYRKIPNKRIVGFPGSRIFSTKFGCIWSRNSADIHRTNLRQTGKSTNGRQNAMFRADNLFYV